MKKDFLASFLIAMILLFALTNCNETNKKIVLQHKFFEGDVIEYKQTTKSKTVKRNKEEILDKSGFNYSGTVTQEVIELLSNDMAKIKETTKSDMKFEKSENNSIIYTLASNGKIFDLEFSSTGESESLTYLKNHSQDATPLFPEIEISRGYMWAHTTKVVCNDQPYEGITTYTVIDIIREAGYDCALIEYNSTMVVPVSITSDSITISGSDEMKSVGKLYFAYKEGIIISQDEQWDIIGSRSSTAVGSDSYIINVSINSSLFLTKLTRTSEL